MAKIKGTKGNDVLAPFLTADQYDGKSGNDIITGGGGNDSIKGGKGLDEARFSGLISEYTFVQSKKGLTISHLGGNGADGTDFLRKDVELIRFANGVVIDPNALNNNPVASDDTAGPVSEDSVLNGASVLGNDFDFDIATGKPQTLSVTAVNGAAIGAAITIASGATVIMNANGTFTYNPAGSILQGLNAGQTATDTFTYTVSDGNGGTDIGQVTITVTGANDSPEFTDADDMFQFNVTENVAVGTVVGTVSAQDVDNSSTVTYAITAGNGAGDFTINTQTGVITTFGAIDFEAIPSYTLTVTASDGLGGTDTATVTISVNDVVMEGGPVNSLPVANNDVASTGEDTILMAASVLLNDTDADMGQTLSVVAVNGAALGGAITLASGATVTMNTNGTYTYNPTGSTLQSLTTGQMGTDTFDYTVSDGNGGTDIGTVTITVNGANDAPNFTGNTGPFSVTENVAIGTFVGSVSAPDPDGGSTVAYAITGGNAAGDFTINAQTGVITTAGAIDFESIPSYNLTVQASDGMGGLDTTPVTINVGNIVDEGGGGGPMPTAGLFGKTLLVQFVSTLGVITNSQTVVVGNGVEFTQSYGLGLLDSFSLDIDNTGFTIDFNPLLGILGLTVAGSLRITDVTDSVTDITIGSVTDSLLLFGPGNVTAPNPNQVNVDFGLAQAVLFDAVVNVDLNFA